DRRHSLQLLAKGVEFELRETYESALVFGRSTLEALGLNPERAAAVEEFVRRRDLDRLALQQAEGISAGVDLLRTRMVHEPLSTPRHVVKPLNPEAEEIIARPPADAQSRCCSSVRGAAKMRTSKQAATTGASKRAEISRKLHPIAGELVGRIEFFQPRARALLPKSVAFGFAEAEEAHCISEHDALDLGVAVPHGPQEKDHHV